VLDFIAKHQAVRAWGGYPKYLAELETITEKTEYLTEMDWVVVFRKLRSAECG
jgi:hypothetical protein